MTERNLFPILFLACHVMFFAAIGCKPHVEVSNAAEFSLPECKGYTAKHTIDEEYLTLTMVLPPQPDVSAPKSYMVSFKLDPEGKGYRFDVASKKSFQDAEPKFDTLVTIQGEALCLDPGPNDNSPDQCLGAWIKAAGEGQKCQVLK